MKKKNIKIIVIAVALFLPYWSTAQDLIRRVNISEPNFALVRQLSGQAKWIECYDFRDIYPYTGSSYFGLFDTVGNTNHFMICDQSIDVYDMELVGNTLYFCGSKYDGLSVSRKGVMGYYDITSMPTPTINYILYDSLTTLKKLDYYMLYATKHVVMVGTGRNGKDYIVDAYHYSNPLYPNNTSWGKAWTYITNDNTKFDDIAVVDTNVVVSARFSDSSVAYLCYIRKNTMIDRPFFSGSVIGTKKIKADPKGPVLLMAGNYDTLYAFFRNSYYLQIHQLKGTHELTAKRIMVDLPLPFFTNTLELLDVCTDFNRRNLGVLLGKRNSSIDYKVYHIPTSKVSSGGTITGHIFNVDNDRVFSLGRSWKNNRTIAAGGHFDGAFYEVQNNVTGNCFSTFSSTLQNDTPVDANVQQKYHTAVRTYSVPSTMTVTEIQGIMTTLQCD